MNADTVAAIIFGGVYVGLVFLMLKIGVKPTWKLMKAGLSRLLEGPNAVIPRRKNCLIEHEIHASELNYYGEIKSESVDEHVRKCKKFTVKTKNNQWVVVPNSYLQTEHLGARRAGDSVPKAPTSEYPQTTSMSHSEKELSYQKTPESTSEKKEPSSPCLHESSEVLDTLEGKRYQVCRKCWNCHELDRRWF